MKKIGGLTAVAAVLLLVTLGVGVNAEILHTTVPLTTANEVSPSPLPPAGATGTTDLTINVTRDAGGNITGAVIQFLTSFSFPGAIVVSGHHIHEQAATANGPIRFNPSLAGVTTDFPTGKGWINLTVISTDADVTKRLIANPAGFYVNLHTAANPAGAVRGQITRLFETLALSVEMNTAEEIPLVTGVNGIGTGTITINVRRNALGEVIGGTVTFTINYDFLLAQTFTGLHIHEGPPGVAAPVVINTGTSNNAPIVAPTGKGTVNIPVEITAANLAVFRRLLANPPGFYVNIHTSQNPGGVIRGQLRNPFTLPPRLHQSSSYVLPSPGTLSTLTFSGYGLDAGTVILINDQLTMTGYDPLTGQLSATVPPALQSAGGPLFVQARRSDGLRSLPLIVHAVTAQNLSTVALAPTNAARFSAAMSPEGIAAIFGANLASTTLSTTSALLSVSLDGTTAYVNGVLASLFFVSPGQVNCLFPAFVLPGTAAVVIVDKNGRVSQGTVAVAPTVSSIFTTRSDGTGAPAARASTDGVNFPLVLGTPDGTPVTVTAGSFVMLFGTNLRFGSALATLTIGTTNVTAMFSGAQGTFLGLDQVNFQIPASLAGAGNVDLVMTLDGKTSNTVKLRIQ